MDTTIKLDSELFEALKQVTAPQGVTVESVIQQLARQYLREKRHAKIQEEFERYQAKHSELKAKYLGQHIAFYQGEVIDQDTDPMALVARVKARLGDAPVLVLQVHEQPIQEFVIRSPRLVRN